jgi:probable F420-dependent oxidoreductase
VKPGRLAISLPAPFLSPLASVELARRAEREWGYEAIWLAETNGPDSASLAGALAIATERATIGTAIVSAFNRTPALLAMTAATLGGLAPGRFVLGLGSSSHAIVEHWNGVPFERPLARVRETVAIVREALAGRKTSFAGEVVSSRGLRLDSVPEQPVPIYVAALRERMLELAGEIGEGLILNLLPVTAMPRILAAYRRGALRAGRDASGDEVVCRFQVAVTDDIAAARNMIRMGFTGYVAQPVYNAYFRWCGFEEEARAVALAFARGDRASSAAAMTDAMIDRIAILGSAERCREQIAEFVSAGVTTPVIAPIATDLAGVGAVFEALAPARAPA